MSRYHTYSFYFALVKLIKFGVIASFIGTGWRLVIFINRLKNIMIKEFILSPPRNDGFKCWVVQDSTHTSLTFVIRHHDVLGFGKKEPAFRNDPDASSENS